MTLKIMMKKFKDLTCTLCGEPIVIAGKEAITFENPRHQRCDNVITQKNKIVAEPVLESEIEVMPEVVVAPARPAIEATGEVIAHYPSKFEGEDGQ